MSLYLAANNGDIGGGEVMLLTLARTLRQLGIEPVLVGPRTPGALIAAGREDGFATVAIAADGRRDYLRGLRSWDRHRTGWLWCHGLVPALATAGRRRRIVHLHRLPTGRLQPLLVPIARRGSTRTLVPSEFMAGALPGAAEVTVLPNWTQELAFDPSASRSADRGGIGSGVRRVGFLGRLTAEKGVHHLATACRRLEEEQPGRLRLVLAGESRFETADDEHLVGDALASVEHLTDRLGWVSPDEFFSQVDLAAFPSVTAESFGLVVAEAMACGVPFVISDAGALPEVAGPRHRWVARADDPDSLTDVLRSALAAPDPDELRMARTRWQASYSPTAGRTRVQDLLGDLGMG